MGYVLIPVPAHERGKNVLDLLMAWGPNYAEYLSRGEVRKGLGRFTFIQLPDYAVPVRNHVLYTGSFV